MKPNIPVLILSAKRTVDGRLKGLKKGGDDYLTKPFAFGKGTGTSSQISQITNPSSLFFVELTINLQICKVVREGY